MKKNGSKHRPKGLVQDTEPPGRRSSGTSPVARLRSLFGHNRVQGAVIACVAIALLTVLLVPKRHIIDLQMFRVGEIARQDIWAPTEITVEDEETTAAKKKAAAAKAPSVYDFDERALSQTIGAIRSTFRALRAGIEKRNELLQSLEQPAAPEGGKQAKSPAKVSTQDKLSGHSEAPAPPEVKPTIAELREQFKQSLGIDVSPEEFDRLVASGFDVAVEDCVVRAFEDACKDGVVGDKALLLSNYKNGIIMRLVGSGKTKTFPASSFFMVSDSQKARAEAAKFVKTECPGSSEFRAVLASVISRLVKPTLTFNKSETEKVKQDAVAAVEPVYFKIKKGQMIVRAREVVTAKQSRLIREIAKKIQPRRRLNSAVGTPLFLVIVAILLSLSGRRFGFEAASHWKNHLLFWTIAVLTLLLSKAFLWGIRAFADAVEQFPFNQQECYYFAAPLGLGAVLISLLMGKRLGLAATIVCSAFVPLLFGNYPVIIMATLLSGVAVVFVAGRYGNGAVVFKMGLSIGIVAAATVLSMQLLDANVKFSQTGYFNAVCGFGQGLVVIAFAGIFLPILELVFGVWTKSKLLDLASNDRPLIKRLMIEAGGTHNHSIRVAELARSACEEIGANGVIAFVGSYYHDIGKLKRPGYFIENTPVGGENPHDHLKPAMSVRILVEHVTYGLELARKKKLPLVVQDIIEQHHGKSLMKPFYHKAQEAAKRTGEVVEESEFRYPGVKPQTRQAGIIMLADSIEAASRVLLEPTRDKISKMVDRIVSWYIEDHQLDECDLSLRDIQKCKETFVHVLQGMLHSRIEYPEDQPGSLQSEVVR